MTTIPFFTSINYARPHSCFEGTLSTLSNYFSLKNTTAIVIKDDEVLLEAGKASYLTAALKVISYILLFPLTLTLLAINLCLRAQHRFTIFSPSPIRIEHPQPIITPSPDPIEEPINTPLVPPVQVEHQQTTSAIAQAIDAIRPQVIAPPPQSFQPFTLRFSDTEVQINSQIEMDAKAQEVIQKVQDKHIKLTFILPGSCWTRSEIITRDQTRAFIDKLRPSLDIGLDQGREWLINVWPKRTEEIQGNLKIRRYSNGIIEEVESTRESDGPSWWDYFTGRRIYPNGVIETGRFDSFQWHSGTRIEEGTTTYRHPQTVINSYSPSLNLLALMYANIDGENRLIVIEQKPGSNEHNFDYIQVQKELIPTLVELLKKGVSSDKLSEVLSGPINCEEFVRYFFKTNALFSVDSHTLTHLLEIIKEKNIIVNLHQRHPETGETLFNYCSVDGKVVKALLDIDPTLIQRTGEGESYLVNSLLGGNKKAATFIMEAMHKANIELVPRELLFNKISFAEGEVTIDELRALSAEDQEIVYRLANIYSNLDIMRKMRTLGFERQDPLMMPRGPSILGCNMDALEMHDTLEHFLGQLRSNGLLKKQSEFARLNTNHYIKKERDIGRILGRDYIEKKIQELGLQHIKVPKKMIVIEDDKTELKLRTGPSLGIEVDYHSGVTIYAEKISRTPRAVTSEEVAELIRLFEATGFSDIHWQNLVVASDGIYIIDTEFTNFWLPFYFVNGRQYCEMAEIVHALPAAQQQAFIDELNAKIRSYVANEVQLNTELGQQNEREKAALTKTGCITGPSFTFDLRALMNE